ncbi:MAG: DNA-processing protein DprA [Actinomycetota bacterium]
MSEREEMLAMLAWSGLPQVGERTLLSLLDHAREARQSMAELWRSRAEDLAQIVPLHPRALAALQENAPAVWAQASADLDEALSRGAELLLPTQPDYPSALWQLSGRPARRWPYVFAFGALGLLEEPRVALVSSRDVSPEGLAITDALADSLARRDLSLVTSTNREAYQASATAAKRHAGPAVMALDRGFDAALPCGLSREPVATARVWDEAFDPELQLLLSPFGWREHWTARNGKRRDSLIFDLADVVVAVDVRAGGQIEQECRRAAERGRAVIALDRGDNTPDGARRLWVEAPTVQRVTWSGGEAVAQAIVRALPSLDPQATGERSARGWLREVSLFLCRLAATAVGNGSAVEAYPEKGVLAGVTQLWAVRGADRSSGLGALVADLWSNPNLTPSRVEQLLSRVAAGGVMVALVPVSWLTEARYGGPRAAWLQGASVRYTAELPPPQDAIAATRPAAVLALQRQPSDREARSFSPEGSAIGRFHLRQYLREVLAVIASEMDAQRQG